MSQPQPSYPSSTFIRSARLPTVPYYRETQRRQKRNDVKVRIREQSRSRGRLPAFMRKGLRRQELG